MARPIMIQGTMSNAGKSLLTAGLLRIFKQDGYRAAPFKSQNMALNSFITKEGLEMGRAQVVQAEAAGMEPDVCMNPILLKPTNDVGSQVIVNGVSIGNMPAKEYFQYKKKLIPDILRAYEKLSEEADIIVIEGAGSPAEINLKENDIVNMGLAEMVDAPVLLVGDIDRGGVFAQLYGTAALLTEKERARVQGLVINKFRGDKSILNPGIEMIEEKCGIPVVGVVPYTRVDIEDEDSLSARLSGKKEAAAIDIAVIRLPRISNFTDFNRFESVGGVSLRYVSSVAELGDPDLIILPGSKNTMGDLAAIRQNGLEAAVLKAHANGILIFGICGGYQMLGEEICDPCRVEQGGCMRGMGLLPVKTVFEEEKTRTRIEGKICAGQGVFRGLKSLPVEGYEIHMGSSTVIPGRETEVVPFSRIHLCGGQEEKEDGFTDGQVYGSYIHGLFDSEQIIDRMLRAIAEKKGISYEKMEMQDYRSYKEGQYDKLADTLRASLDMEKIYAIMGIPGEGAGHE